MRRAPDRWLLVQLKYRARKCKTLFCWVNLYFYLNLVPIPVIFLAKFRPGYSKFRIWVLDWTHSLKKMWHFLDPGLIRFYIHFVFFNSKWDLDAERPFFTLSAFSPPQCNRISTCSNCQIWNVFTRFHICVEFQTNISHDFYIFVYKMAYSPFSCTV